MAAMSTSRPMLTQQEAAAACGVSRTTIRRRREDGKLPNAVLDPHRGWLVPVEDLLAAGLRLNAPAPPDATPPGGVVRDAERHGQDDEVARLRAELERLRSDHALELARAEHARELADARAEHLAERLRERGEHIEDLQRALAALMPAPERAAIPPPAAPPGAAVPRREADAEPGGNRQPRRRWLRGRRD